MGIGGSVGGVSITCFIYWRWAMFDNGALCGITAGTASIRVAELTM